MLMLRVRGNLRGVLQRVTPPTEPCISNYITEEYLKRHFLCAKLVKSSLQKKCLNNLVPKYLTQYILQGMGICTIVQPEEATTCTHPSQKARWAKELLSMQGLFISILYSIMLKVPRL